MPNFSRYMHVLGRPRLTSAFCRAVSRTDIDEWALRTRNRTSLKLANLVPPSELRSAARSTDLTRGVDELDGVNQDKRRKDFLGGHNHLRTVDFLIASLPNAPMHWSPPGRVLEIHVLV